MNKHAYIIVAYNNWQILNKQLELLDCLQNDIYLLIDKKSSDFDKNNLYRCKHSNLHLMERVDIYWAEFSQVEVMLNIMRYAMQQENESLNYTYFHFFSGTCLPIKSQKYIHSFCDKQQKEFIGIVPKEFWYSTRRVKFYWPLLNNKYFKKFKLLKAFVNFLVFLQRIFGVNRLKNYEGIIYNGWDWASITHDFADYLLKNESQIREMFRMTLCPSELWLHTLAYNAPPRFCDRLYDVTDLKNGSMRYIDWQRGRPYTWGAEEGDFETLMNSPYLFARKFDEKHYEIVEKIFNEVKTRNENDQ